MKVYQELTLLPNESQEVSLYFIWSKLYQQLHMAWVDTKDERGKVSTGVSFPQYDYSLGQLGHKLRILAPNENEMQELKLSKWLLRLSDYVHVTSIREVPEAPQAHVVFKRLQTKSSVERLGRRSAKHQGVSLEESLESLGNKADVHSRAPFIHIKSQSSKRTFRLMIACEEVEHAKYEGRFSTYGLSSNESEATVPLF